MASDYFRDGSLVPMLILTFSLVRTNSFRCRRGNEEMKEWKKNKSLFVEIVVTKPMLSYQSAAAIHSQLIRV